LEFWDTAGQEKYHAQTENYFRNAHASVLVYDISDRKSFDQILYWTNKIKLHCSQDVAILLVGNKSDLAENRQVDVKDAQRLILNTPELLRYIETSAKTGEKVNDAFLYLAQTLLDSNDNPTVENSIVMTGSTDDNRSPSKACC